MDTKVVCNTSAAKQDAHDTQLSASVPRADVCLHSLSLASRALLKTSRNDQWHLALSPHTACRFDSGQAKL